MIEIAGYASSTGTKSQNQQLSDARAEAVTHYLLEVKNVPMWRILVPAGYGALHPAATNTDAQGRAENRRVEVTVLVNKGLTKQMYLPVSLLFLLQKFLLPANHSNQ